MKNIFLIVVFFLFISPLFGQNGGGKMSYVTYSKLKAESNLPDMTNIEVVYPDAVVKKKKELPSGSTLKASSSCYGYTPPSIGAVSQTVLDDNSFNVTLNFPFCFYGTPYTSVWVNDNGNITFTTSSGSFSSTGFPTSPDKMIAPFWADFHQGSFGGNGLIWYENLGTALIVHWENVGYYNSQVDKLNTMQLIITDGLDPLLSPGNNVGFFYDDMQWTTGSASGGVNGFGGTASTVGVNKGDGTTFIQLGRFDQAGIAYDGAYGNPDGVDWLDNKTFMFNVCNSTNVPPIATGIDICDTIQLCVGDTMPVNFSVISGESGQTSTIVLDSSAISNYTVISNTPGNTAIVNSYLVGDTSNMGINTLSVMAFDDGTPADTIWFDLIVYVDTIPFHPSVTGNSIICFGQTVSLVATPGFDSYLWSNGGTIDSISVGGGNYSVTATIGGCSETTPIHVVNEFTRNIPTIGGDTVICLTGNALLDVVTLYIVDTIPYTSYLWSPINLTTDSVSVGVGSYSVVSIDTSGCSETSVTINVVDFFTGVAITGPNLYCAGDSVLLDAGPGFDSYLWNTGNLGDTLQTIYVQAGTYSVLVTDSSCSASVSHTVTEEPLVIPTISGDSSYCFGASPVSLSTETTFTSVEWLPNGQTTTSITASQGSYQVVGFYSICSDTSTVFVVTERDPLYANVNFTDFVCTGDSTLVVSITNFANYSWSNGQTGNSIYMSQGGVYTLTITDSFPCTYDTTIIISQVNIPSLSGDTIACNGAYQFSLNTAPQGVLWSYSGPGVLNFQNSMNDLNPLITTSTNGLYTLTMTDDKCMDTLVHEVYFENNPQYLLIDQEICFGEDQVFDVTQDLMIVGYKWNTGLNDALILASDSGWYTVEITGYCQVITDSVYLTTVNCEIPNVLTPNNDGVNDAFVTRIAQIHDDVILSIFNRWGKKVYESDNYDNTWKGTKTNGGKLSSGTYFYVMYWNGATESASGTITLFDAR